MFVVALIFYYVMDTHLEVCQCVIGLLSFLVQTDILLLQSLIRLTVEPLCYAKTFDVSGWHTFALCGARRSDTCSGAVAGQGS